MDATRRGNRLLTLTLIFISGISWFCQEMQSTAQAADVSSEPTSVKPLYGMTLLTQPPRSRNEMIRSYKRRAI